MTNPSSGAYNNGLTSVGTSPTLIAVALSAGMSGILVYNAGSQTVYLGGASVAASGANQGFPLAASASINVPSVGGPANQLYAITASSTSNVVVLFASGA
jgi:hypothetical protein